MKYHPKVLIQLSGLFLVLSLLWSCQSNTDLATTAPIYNQEILSEEGELILVGQINHEAWQMESYKYWFDHEYQAYDLDEATLSNLNFSEKGLSVKVFLGTWCSDSQREVPRLYKILDYLAFDKAQLDVVGLDNHPDRYKQSPLGEEKVWNIEYVPTIIILKEGVEIGRIVESPVVSLEKDLLEILLRPERIVL